MKTEQGTGEVALEERPEIVELQTLSRTLAATAANIKVKDPASDQRATDFLVRVKSAQKAVEKARLAITQPLLESKRAADKLFKNIAKPFADAEVVVNAKKKAYFLEQERERRQEEERIRKENERREAGRIRLEAEAAEKNQPAPEPAPELEPIAAAPPETAKTVRGMEGGSSTMRDHWTFEITNREEIPHRWWVVDETAIQKVVNAGVRDIPGIRIYNDPIVSTRTG